MAAHLTPEPQGAGLGAPPFPGVFAHRADRSARPTTTWRALCHERGVRIPKCWVSAVKKGPWPADRWHMIISDQQVRLVRDYLHTQNASASEPTIVPPAGVTPDLMDRVRREIALAPETRLDRVAEARELIAGDGMSSDEVATKMIGRILSDSIR
jgi:hypothetical protein